MIPEMSQFYTQLEKASGLIFNPNDFHCWRYFIRQNLEVQQKEGTS